MAVWIVSQLGAREHYALARALHQNNQLHSLLTDAWVRPNTLPYWLPDKLFRSLGDRYHADLATLSVTASTRALVAFEVTQRLLLRSGWTSIIARNDWFQHQALQQLKRSESQLKHQLGPSEKPILFSYSYTALTLFRYAKQRGWKTVLGQIDPGLSEQKRVAKLQQRYGPLYASTWTPAPNGYWQHWQQECDLADHILVNSAWSQQALIEVGVSTDKIAIVPLAYQAPSSARSFVRQYPRAFTSKRPLRVLFLGQIILRKGIAAIIEAMSLFSDLSIESWPIEIWLVGSSELDLSAALSAYPQLKWLGAVPRSQVQRYYQQADVFLFPTHSDGFGLTQLEAQAWKLPIIASKSCGNIVTHQQNGLCLADVSGASVAAALRHCCQHPEQLQQWSNQSVNMQPYDLSQLAKTLQKIAHAPI